MQTFIIGLKIERSCDKFLGKMISRDHSEISDLTECQCHICNEFLLKILLIFNAFGEIFGFLAILEAFKYRINKASKSPRLSECISGDSADFPQ